eukprot:CAMPEP_0182495004 /NCGR_PEP_ID=MMETSP1321-20130603/3824_1 /TAXON_ID=91990 /ORGANISM="Bolidomonas sp., Strain RCC1657" /LENGTH=180 /DNA_ID=CAMNT_0024698251 /DNA_START=24 /DNA_END=566 /DNA_ORIENTATION=+
MTRSGKKEKKEKEEERKLKIKNSVDEVLLCGGVGLNHDQLEDLLKKHMLAHKKISNRSEPLIKEELAILFVLILRLILQAFIRWTIIHNILSVTGLTTSIAFGEFTPFFCCEAYYYLPDIFGENAVRGWANCLLHDEAKDWKWACLVSPRWWLSTLIDAFESLVYLGQIFGFFGGTDEGH